ncbi:MAG: MFS transporter [Candidatus Melainabacteria bacterium]|nr:MFS transporter [Candidatus Melainabacteria bacterium]
MSKAPAFEREKSVESGSGAPIVEHGRATKGEIAAWAAYDIANATYGTVVATAVYNAYFVEVICGQATGGKEFGTFLLSVIIIPLSALAIVLTAPVLGTIVDAMAAKKKLLFVTTVLCILCTATLSMIPPGQVWGAVIALTLANFFFGTGEDLIASFLPELSTQENMGRISSIGWGAGYVGSLIALGLCFLYFTWAKAHGQMQTEYVPFAMLICAILFFVFSLPTFIFLKERATPLSDVVGKNYIKVGFDRLRHTINHARHYRDLFNFLLTLCVYSCGSTTVIHLASV